MFEEWAYARYLVTCPGCADTITLIGDPIEGEAVECAECETVTKVIGVKP